MKKQACNPFLPSFEYVPDGEPHVFGDRVYLYGSHDRFGGVAFCLNDYVCYSADISNLCEWRYEGVIYSKYQDPRNQNIPLDVAEFPLMIGYVLEKENSVNPKGVHAMYAPDVVRGIDGKYYLYYCLDWLPEIGVAVCDEPSGKYEFLGFVRHKDGTILGQKEGDFFQFDPGIFIDDDQEIYLYSGNAPMKPEYDNGKMSSQVMTLEKDMVTLATEPKSLLPSIMESKGTGYEGHEFFEASSIRKKGDTYYLIYSSINSHELNYAMSKKPDRDFVYGGTIVDIADIYFQGRTEEQGVNCLGNTHGGIEEINGKWYIFYHRQSNRTNFSRQACAQQIEFDEEGRIHQVEVSSVGFDQKAFIDEGIYPAYICSHLTGKKGITFSHPLAMKMDYPYLTQDQEDVDPILNESYGMEEEPIQYIKNIQDGSTVGFKYFEFSEDRTIKLTLRGHVQGLIKLYQFLDESCIGSESVLIDSNDWITCSIQIKPVKGVAPLYMIFHGTGSLDFKSLQLIQM